MPKGPKVPPIPLASPKASMSKVTSPQTEENNAGSSPPPVSPRGHQKVNSGGGTPTGMITPRGHTKIQSSGSSNNANITPTATNAQPPIVPRPGLVRAATANPAGHVKVGPPVVPQPIQSNIIDSPKASSAPANLTYLEYDLQAVIDLANQFVGLALQTMTPQVNLLILLHRSI